MSIPGQVCVVCGEPTVTRTTEWTFYCAPCDYWSSCLTPNIESDSDFVFERKETVIDFLEDLRVRNFNLILNKVSEFHKLPYLKILDVGCATGVFLDVANSLGHTVTGVEPNAAMCAAARFKGRDVVEGYFPEALPSKATYDVVTFNDVFEHMPQLHSVLNGVESTLGRGGLLVLNLPSSHGLFFTLGKLLCGLGVCQLWERLWQKMFYTPHLHYFSKKSIVKLLSERASFVVLFVGEIDTVSASGLWGRLSADQERSLTFRISAFVATLLLLPFSKVFERDSIFVIARRCD